MYKQQGTFLIKTLNLKNQNKTVLLDLQQYCCISEPAGFVTFWGPTYFGTIDLYYMQCVSVFAWHVHENLCADVGEEAVRVLQNIA